MTFTEVKQDLFQTEQGYYLAHCISGDYALGAGIAVLFDAAYEMRFKLHMMYPIPEGERYANVGSALLVDNVFNLVTKARGFHTPTYEDLERSLINMRNQCEERYITKVAMPKIASGLDRLDWDQVKNIIQDVFEDTEIDIRICTID